MEERKYTQPSGASPSEGDPKPPSRSGEVVIPVIEEHVTIDKREVETGTVRVTRHVFEREEPVHVIVTHDECHVEHVPAGYYVDAAPGVRYEGDTMIIPVLREVAVVEKKLLLVEELRITRTQVQTQSTEQIRLRSESIEVSRIPSGNADVPPKQ